MSVMRDCSIYKAQDGKWYMELEDIHYREKYEYYGPFTSFAATLAELNKHSNPGGYEMDDSGTRAVPKSLVDTKVTNGIDALGFIVDWDAYHKSIRRY